MNTITQKIKSKGYSLTKALKVIGLSLSSYRRYEKENNPNHAMLNRLVDELKDANNDT